MNSSEKGLPTEQILCLKLQHNWEYNFFSKSQYNSFKVTSLQVELALRQDQIWSSLLQWLMASLTPVKEV